ncbi:uncharacterized protein LOC134775981 isoform X1 [Penaeus indicus]|uniref:uncharacterized protein LOC134775981 isoform X1 n=1 Tax=Penaeus indicus TaxID=29960 RepID=UPI00300CD568
MIRVEQILYTFSVPSTPTSTPQSCPPRASYFASDLDRKLDTSMANLCRDGVKSTSNSIIINSFFKWFRSDFGATEQDVLRFLATCSDDPVKSSALRAAADGSRNYTYSFDWTFDNLSLTDIFQAPFLIRCRDNCRGNGVLNNSDVKDDTN